MASDFNLIRLDSSEPEKVYDCFLKGFADYNLKIQPTFEEFLIFLKRNGFDPHLSFGVTYERMLVGIILNCPSNSGFYSCGLAVRPKYRSGGIGKTLINKTLSCTSSLTLECLDVNLPALSFYEKLGFRKVRRLMLYSGMVEESYIQAKEVPLSSILDEYRPSHQNTREALERIKPLCYTFGSSFISFSSFGEVHFLITKDVEEGVKLLSFASRETGRPLSAINIDERNTITLEAFSRAGMKYIGSQLELIKS